MQGVGDMKRMERQRGVHHKRIDLERHREDSRTEEKIHQHSGARGIILVLVGVGVGSRTRRDVGGSIVARAGTSGGRRRECVRKVGCHLQSCWYSRWRVGRRRRRSYR